MRDELKAALTPDAGSLAAPVPTERPLTELERKAALTQAQGEIRRKYGHLTEIDPKVLQETVSFAKAISDPSQQVGFLAKLIGELMQNPTQAMALRGALAQHFGQPPVAAPPNTEPQFYVRGADGQTYIDPDKFAEWQKWRDGEMRAEFQKELNPLKATADELRMQKEAVAIDRKVTEFTTSVHGYIQSLPDYAANRQEIASAFDEDVTALLQRNPTASPEAIEACALKAYQRVTLPKAAQSAEARVQATLKAKAEARNASPNGNGRSAVAAKEQALDLRTELKKALLEK